MVAGRRRTRVRHDHWRWLELVDRDGPFVSIPALKQVWPQGIVPLATAREVIRDAKPAFDSAWDALQLGMGDSETQLTNFRASRDTWVRKVLRNAFLWQQQLVLDDEQDVLNVSVGQWPEVHSPDRRHSVRASGLYIRDGERYALLLVVDPVTSLRDPGADGWSASSIDRIELLLRRSNVPIGVVTDGRWWAVVSAQRELMVASGIVDSQTWIEEPEVFNGVRAMLDPRCLASRPTNHRLDSLFRDSVDAAEEITEQLGAQVRKAVELLVAAFSDATLHGAGSEYGPVLSGDPDEVYQAAVTTMMRVVFLLFAEERDLMPTTTLYSAGYAMSGRLDELERRSTEEGGQSLDATSRTWHRLLATSRALYSGVSTEDMRLPAYGGSLFDPSRYPFLNAVGNNGLRIQVSDRVMLEVLRALQRAEIGGEKRSISFRDIDVEQIGYIYEGLLGYSAAIVESTTIGLIGGSRSAGAEPEILLNKLDELAKKADGDHETFAAEIITWTKKNQPGSKPPTQKQLVKALAAGEQLVQSEALLHAVTSDSELRERLRPYVGIIRRDLRDRLLVIEAGGLVVVETPSRATSGAHYTPKNLAQEVVQHALEPLVYKPGPYQTSDSSAWVPLRSNEILELKVVDIACGSGAFLVSAAEYLADRLVEAYQREGVAQGSAPQQRRSALREVVAACLYGADINAMAVEMCKLSLWLVSLDPTKPFSFVDDKILCGNSLLGITEEAHLRAIDLNLSKHSVQTNEPPMFSSWSQGRLLDPLDVDGVLQDAADLRRRLASPVDDADPQRAAKTKRRLWEEYQDKVGTLLRVADGMIAASLRAGGKPGRRRNAEFEALREAVDQAFARNGPQDTKMLDTIIKTGLTPEVKTDYEQWRPLHWAIVVPDVLNRGGFDAVIGNPPWQGGKKISLAVGANVREWMIDQISGVRSSADIVAYFLVRAAGLLRTDGTLGLLTAVAVSEGGTRKAGLDTLIEAGFTIVRAVRSRVWPAKSAETDFSAVWGTFADIPSTVLRNIDSIDVAQISSKLEPAGRIAGNAKKLLENRDQAFIGCNINGKGFELPRLVAQSIIQSESKYSLVIRPLMRGEVMNDLPTFLSPERVVDLYPLSLEEAKNFPKALEWLEEHVKSERISNDTKPKLAEYWWRFERDAKKLREALKERSEVLALTLTSKTMAIVRVSANQVFGHSVAVFPYATYSLQAVLSSSIHRDWGISQGSGRRAEPRYTPSDSFETFPRPDSTDGLDAIGHTLNEERNEIMRRRGLGLTALYNLVNDPAIHGENDPDIAKMRRIHTDLDHRVMEAYGWGDVNLDHGFHTYRQMVRWTVGPEARAEILDRLLEENHRRAAEEAGSSEQTALLPNNSDEELSDAIAEGTTDS